MAGVSLRRLLPILVLALILAPFGRMDMAEAKAMPPHAAMQMGGHCADQPQPAGAPDQERMGVDCMVACAAMHMAAQAFSVPPEATPRSPESPTQSDLAGIRPEAEPPPPRRS